MMMTNPVNADLEKEVAEKLQIDPRVICTFDAHSIVRKIWAALLAEAGERAKLEARVEGWKKAFGTQTPEETCSLFRAMEIVALRKMLTAEQRNMLTDRRTTLLESDLATEAERARGLEAQLEAARQALKAAHEWAAKFPIQGGASIGDQRAANHVYMLTESALSQLPTPAQQRAEGWIPVGERLPEVGVGLLLATNEGAVESGSFAGESFYLERTGPQDHTIMFDLHDGQITHWMPLPAPPVALPTTPEDL